MRSRMLRRDTDPGFNVESVLPPSAPQTSSNETFDADRLAEFSGKDGKKCYVAIDTTVYDIEQGRLWKDGQHVTSGGQAMCGKDLTEVIKRSPHGRSKLEGLPKVGVYEKS